MDSIGGGKIIGNPGNHGGVNINAYSTIIINGGTFDTMASFRKEIGLATDNLIINGGTFYGRIMTMNGFKTTINSCVIHSPYDSDSSQMTDSEYLQLFLNQIDNVTINGSITQDRNNNTLTITK